MTPPQQATPPQQHAPSLDPAAAGLGMIAAAAGTAAVVAAGSQQGPPQAAPYQPGLSDPQPPPVSSLSVFDIIGVVS